MRRRKRSSTDSTTLCLLALALLLLCLPMSRAQSCNPGEYWDGGSCQNCASGHISSGGSATTCSQCSAGTYANSGHDTCVACASGYISSVGQQDSCTNQCSAGKFANSAHTSCTTCPSGYISTAGTQGSCSTQCTAGTYARSDHTNCDTCAIGYISSAGQQDSCTNQCSAGQFANSAHTSCTTCPSGYISTAGTQDSCSTQCTAGQYANAGHTTCLTCDTGTVSSSAGSQGSCPTTCQAGEKANAGHTACEACPGGSISTAGSDTCSSCSSGYYADSGDTTCTICPPGYECPDGGNMPIRCRGGYYSGAGEANCSPCTAGSVCPDGHGSELSCGAGFYSDAKASKCIECPAGHACTDGDPNNVNQCTPGTYAYKGSSSCTTCPQGYYCPRIDSGPILCPDGYWSSSGAASCSICAAGYECTNKTSQTACSSGYSYAGDFNCRDCPGGFGCSDPASQPVACADGYYSAYGADTCSACTAGSYCPPYAIAKITCPDGTYSLAAANTCTRCPAGSECSSKGANPTACSSGKYSFEMSMACTDCPAGYACPNTYSPPAPCPPGYYSLGNSTGCTICPAGSYCEQTDVSPIACATGYYSMAGWTMCQPCPIGYYCSSKAALPVLIATDKYTVLAAASEQTCNAGQARTSGGTCVDCPSGYTSVGGNNIRCVPCSPGFECDKDAAQVKCVDNQHSYWMTETCRTCTVAGHQCMFRERDYIEPCPHGTYMPDDNTDTLMCKPCPAGFSCIRNNVATGCASGEYSLEGDANCHKCPSGASCATQTTYTMCTLGQYSENAACEDCPDGHYCPDIFQTKQPCPPGTYQVGPNKLYCQACAAGTYTDSYGSASCTNCPAGSYCPSTDKPPILCPFGTYSSANSMICSRCTDGYLCKTGEITATPASQTCSNGYICNPARQLVGSHHNVPCPPGYKSNSAGEDSRLTACTDCPAGSYCPAGTDTEIPCLAGHYCPLNTKYATEFPCPEGTYRTATGATQLLDCVDCDAGKFCPRGTSTPFDCPPGAYCTDNSSGNPLLARCPGGTYSGQSNVATAAGCTACPAGYYCPIGSIVPTPCPPGTVNSLTNKQSIYDCVAPTPGKQATIWANSNADGDACKAGHYCPIGSFGSPFPCPAGTFTDSTTLTAASQCDQCTAGFACEEGTGAGVKDKKKCAAGHYCPLGSSDPYANPCPAGKYSANVDNEADTDCDTCPAGYYCLKGSTNYIYECPKGYYCTAGTTSSYEHPCPAGTYNHITKLKADTECFVCPAGYYCEEASTEPIACPEGTYAPGTGYEAAYDDGVVKGCETCPAGETCDSPGTTTTTTCGVGYYSYAGTTTCLLCQAGHYCPDTSTTGVNHDTNYICGPGYLCPAGMTVDPTTQGDTYKCPAGYYCEEEATEATPCLAGTYNPDVGGESVLDCDPSPAGHYTGEASSTTGTLCSVGYYCEEGTTGEAAIPCPIGTFRDTPGAEDENDCAACTAGYYCGEATYDPTICPQGYYCEEGTSTPSSCPAGTFGASVGLTASSECHACLPGMYCSQLGLRAPDGLCDIGYFCNEGATTPNPTDGIQGNVCVAGGFCDLGSFESVTCKPGTFNENTRGTSEADCIACPAGSYCNGTFIDQVSGVCNAGYYCEAGSTIPTAIAASKGHYSGTNATEETECGTGTYNPSPGQSACQNCLEGYYCDETGLSDNIKNCPTGNYCPTGTINPTRCPQGTYRDLTNGIEEADCMACPSGSYCNSEGLSSVPGLCSAGYYCKVGSTTQEPLTVDASGNFGPCPVGHYCPEGTGEPIPCPPGTYNAVTKMTELDDCLNCSAGTYCSESGRSSDGDSCSAGYYCVEATTQSKPASGKCTAGNYCPLGSASETPCAAGTYQDQGEQSSCITCPAGYYCIAGSNSPGTICPAGYYCPSGTAAINSYPCPIGTYNPQTGAQTSSQCKACKPGHYCQTTGLNAPTGVCTKGYYCTTGSSTPTPPSGSETRYNTCKAGTYCPAGSAYAIPCKPGYACPNNLMGDADLQNCQAGYYCPEGSTSTTQNICPAGYYCPLNSRVPTPCPRGTYGPSTRLTAADQCSTCSVGSYCEKAALTAPTGSCASGYFCKDTHYVARPETEHCPAGYMCGVGSTDKTKCTTGYQDNILQSSCKTCPAGFQCPDNGSGELVSKVMCNAKDDANESFYCPAGDLGTTSCGAGMYSVSMLASTLATDCQECPPGFFCENTDSTDKFQECPEGYICEAGSSTSTGSEQCVAGFYCPAGHAAMMPCTPGKYCETAGLDDVTGDCSAGYYCKEGATTATPTDGTTGNTCTYGHYCEAGTSDPVACPIGKYLDLTGQDELTDCKDCETGYICEDLGLQSPSETCQEGYYCEFVSGVQMEYPCPPGYKCPAGVFEKVHCPSGTYQYFSNKGTCTTCPERYYCMRDTSDDTDILSEPTICQAGKYCAAGTADEGVDCPAGTFSSQSGLATAAECEDCPAGYYCTGGATAPDGPCQAGYYCLGKASIANPADTVTGNKCPVGHYCPSGSYEPTKCPKGTVNDQEGDDEVGDCEACALGFYCPYLGATSSTIDYSSNTHKCKAGYICLGGSKKPYGTDGTIAKACGAGKYCPRGATSETDCPLGTYNPSEAAGSCTACPKGKVCDSLGMAAPDPCPAGYYCPIGTPDNDNKIKCPAGTFSNDTNLSEVGECAPCPPGKFCPEGTTDPTLSTYDCDAGYYCVISSTTATPSGTYVIGTELNGECPAGFYCEAGTISPTPCPVGKYRNATKGTQESDCSACTAGHYCDELGIDEDTLIEKVCTAGFYCIQGATTPTPTDGTTGKVCDAGKYCPEGTTSMMDCPGGSYEPRQMTSSSTCQTCPAGYFCGAASVEPTICPIKNFCPAGSTTATVCPDGRYNDDQTGLEASDQCKECPTGWYCTNGEITDRCNAGYHCDTGATSSTDSNYQCPLGYYCPVYTSADCGDVDADCAACSDDACKKEKCCLFPIRCPENTIRETLGATQKSECASCPLGYYCLAGSNTKKVCPRGFYCPSTGDEKIIACPEGTYNDEVLQYLVTDCQNCGPGYLCNKKGIADRDDFQCPLGYYCPEATTDDSTKVVCPQGTYRDTIGAATVNDCHECPEGYFCVENTIHPTACKGGYYCPAGSYEETICPQGYYCHEKSADKTICPEAFYCPEQTDEYIKCSEHYYCPEGSYEETPCPAGTIGWGNPYNNNPTNGCTDCDPGTYSTEDIIGECPDCPAGYVCLGGTITASPTNETRDMGYECPAGYYCPTGSSSPTACAAGTYSGSTKNTEAADCETCPAQSFSAKEASTSCTSCGGTSRADAGSTECSCIGSNRKYLVNSQMCVCVDRYESATSGNEQVDSEEDCSRALVEECDDTADTEGNCVSTDESCYDACGSDGGTRYLGLCQCKSMTLTNDVCPSSCRDSRYTFTFSASGQILILDSDGDEVDSFDPAELTGLSGTFDYDEDDSNAIYSIGLQGSTFTSNYEASDYFSSICTNCNNSTRRMLSDGRRSLAPSGYISNPVICISTGESLLFDVNSSDKSYPVYVTGSLLNTNTDFDYSDFLTLASDINSGTTVNQFIFKFTEEGVYVFENSLDSSQQMVLGVMGEGSKCPDDSEYISPTSLKSLLLIGAAESDVVYEPDWVFISLLLLSLMVLIGIMIGVYYYIRRSWKTKNRRKIKYRKLNLNNDELHSIRADNACFTYMQKNKDLRILKRMNQKMNRDITYTEIENIRIRLKNHTEKLAGKLYGGVDDGYDDLNLHLNNDSTKNNVMLELKKLKDLITDHKKNILGEFDEDYSDEDESNKPNKQSNLAFLGDALAASKRLGQDIVDEGNKQDDDELNKMMMQIRKRKEKIDGEVDGDLDQQKRDLRRKLQDLDGEADGDLRKKLLEELQSKLDRVDDTLKNEELSQKQALEAKLAQRKKRRGKIVDDFTELQKQKFELKDNTALRNKIDQDIEKEIDEMEEELEKERQEGLDIIQENIKNAKRSKLEDFENKLRKGAGDKKNFDKYLDEYSKAEKGIQDELRAEQRAQEQKLNDELRKRRDARLAKIEAQKGEMVEEAKNDIGEKLREIEEKERAFEGLKIKELDPFLKDIVIKSEQKVGGKMQLGLLREEADRALLKYRQAEGEERERIRQELMEKYKDQDAEEDEEIRKFREQLLKEILDKEEEKEAHLAHLKAKLDSAPTAEEKASLIEEHNQYKADIEDELQRMANDSTNQLKQRLRDRRAKRKQEEDALLKKRLAELENEKQDEEDNLKRSYDETREETEDKTIEEVVRGLQAALPKEEIPTSLEKILDDRQMRELVDLLMRQYAEKAQAMKDELIKLMNDKANEIDEMNKEYGQARKFLRDAYEKGGITEDAFEKEMEALKEKQKQMMDGINEKYSNLEVEREQDIRRNFIERHTNEQIELEEKHMREREKYFSKLLPESAMKRIIRGYEQLNDEEINDLIREKNEEKEAKIRELEKMMASLRSEIDTYQNEIDDLDEYERKLREKELMEQRRFDIRKQKLLDEKKRQQQAELSMAQSEDQRAEMIKKHLQELENLKVVLEKERKRQLDIHEEQFRRKREAIDAKRKELQAKIEEEKRKKLEKLEEEERKRQEMSELEKKRQQNLKKLIEECNEQLFTYDKPAYSAQIDWADRQFKPKKPVDFGSTFTQAFTGGQKITKEERLKQRIANIQKSNKGPMSLELLARIERLEEIVTDMTNNKYAKVLEEFPEL